MPVTRAIRGVQPRTAEGFLHGEEILGCGVLYFSQDGNANGLYTLDTSTGAPTFVGATGVNASTVGLTPSASDSLLYGSRPFALLHISADGMGFGLIARRSDSDSDTFYYVTVTAGSGGSDTLRICKSVDGTETVLLDTQVNASDDTWYKMRFLCKTNGSSTDMKV